MDGGKCCLRCAICPERWGGGGWQKLCYLSASRRWYLKLTLTNIAAKLLMPNRGSLRQPLIVDMPGGSFRKRSNNIYGFKLLCSAMMSVRLQRFDICKHGKLPKLST